MDWLDIIVCLGAAILIGGVIGLDRNLHHKPTGVRTLGLVAVGAALAVMAVAHDRQADVSRASTRVLASLAPT
jgi:putative Mg2+ transporter-C (MgtC) family protein